MEGTRYEDNNDDTDNDSDSSSTSTDSGVPTKTTHSSHTYINTTSIPVDTAPYGNRPREIVAESDGDDTSSSDSSTDDGNVPTHKRSADINTNIPNDKTAMDPSRDQTTHEDAELRPGPTSNDKSLVAKKEAARLSARLGHMSIVDSVVIRKKMRDKISENVLYDEIGKLVTDNTDEVEADKEDDYPKQTQTDDTDTKPPTHQSPEEDSQSSQSSDSDKNSNKSVPSDDSFVEDGTELGTPATIEVRQEVAGKWTSDLEEVELDNVVETRDGTANDGSKRGVFSSCQSKQFIGTGGLALNAACCFRGTRTS